MKANELMVGDLVSYSGIVNRVALADFCQKAWIDEIRPIPLTPEILEKLGFVQSTSFKNVYRLILNDEYYVIINMENGLYLNITKIADDGAEEYNYNTPNPKFVHELQHAFRLCGIEKEIEL